MGKYCKFNDKISLFIDGELSLKELKNIESHIEKCPACRKESETLIELNKILTGTGEIEPSPGFDPAFWQKVNKMDKKTTGWSLTDFTFSEWFSGWRPYAATAMVVFIVAIILVFGKLSPLKTNDIIIADHLELFQDFEIINQLDLLENWEVIISLSSEKK